MAQLCFPNLILWAARLLQSYGNTPTSPEVPVSQGPVSRFQKLKQKLSSKRNVDAPGPVSPLPSEEGPMKTYEERLHDAHAHAERMIMALLYSWEVEDFPLPEGSEEFDNMRFWRTTAQFPYLKRVAALFAGRPPSQVEDERHFSQTGVIITARRARLYPIT